MIYRNLYKYFQAEDHYELWIADATEQCLLSIFLLFAILMHCYRNILIYF